MDLVNRNHRPLNKKIRYSNKELQIRKIQKRKNGLL